MSARLTVVLDDEELYRKLKVRAAQDGVAMKDLVEAGLRMALNEDASISVPSATGAAGEPGRAFDWDRYDEMMEQWKAEDGRLGISPGPTDLSDVKRHLYGSAERNTEGVRRVAEERARYDAD